MLHMHHVMTTLRTRAESSQAACVVCVSELAELEPLELHRRGASLTTVEVARGSWMVGKMPGVHTRISEHANMAGAGGRRRNSLSLANHDSSAVRSALGVAQKMSINLQAVAGPGESSSACV